MLLCNLLVGLFIPRALANRLQVLKHPFPAPSPPPCALSSSELNTAIVSDPRLVNGSRVHAGVPQWTECPAGMGNLGTAAGGYANTSGSSDGGSDGDGSGNAGDDGGHGQNKCEFSLTFWMRYVIRCTLYTAC